MSLLYLPMTKTFPTLSGSILAAALLYCSGALHAQTAVPASSPIAPRTATPVQASDLDPATYAEWMDGQEKPIARPDKAQNPDWIIWTDTTRPGHSGLAFGDSATAGPRHLRIGFKKDVPVGSVIVRNGGKLSVLKPGATYPGDLAKEEDWIPAQRLDQGEVSDAELTKKEVGIWTMPPGTQTRALRFTHVAEATDADYAGSMGSLFVTADRWVNIAPQALSGTSIASKNAPRINNGNDDSDRPWDNLDRGQPAPESAPVVSPQNAPWVLLTWPKAVKLGALVATDCGFGTAEVQAYSGSADHHPRDAGDADWKTIATFTGMKHGYPTQLTPNVLIFPQVTTTRALRVRMIGAVDNGGHPHRKDANKGDKRVWIGELMALQPLGEAPIQPVEFPVITDGPHPPIPVRFALKEPGYVTLVIENADGVRVRNLVSETLFPAGDNVAWWDGTDDLGRDVDAAQHGVYKIPAQFVGPGTYKVRGLARGKIMPHYEFSVYSSGYPTWETSDKTGGWLTNHTPPQSTIFVPAEKSPTGVPMVYLGSAVSEGGAGLAWVNLEGKKLGGRGWIGGNWTAAPFLAYDSGAKAIAGSYAYVGATWTASENNKDRSKGELRITALTDKGDKSIIKYAFAPPPVDEAEGGGDHFWVDQLGGIAVNNGIVVASMNKLNMLLFIDAATGKVLGESPVERPRALAFDKEGRLLVLSGKNLLRYELDAAAPARLGAARTIVGKGLEDPHGLTIDAQGQIYVSDAGTSHQVKIFSSDGKSIRTVGKPGVPKAGPYDPLHMNHPAGMVVDSNNRLWVTENDYLPKRVSVWNADGTLYKAFYGPAKYGGGGTLDPRDKTRFFYADEGRGTLEFKLDWVKGESQLVRVLYRREPEGMKMPFRSAAPELPLVHEGRQYFSNCYNSNPTGGHHTAFIFVEKDGIAIPAAAIGRAKDWEILQTEAFASRVPASTNWKKDSPLFLWSDVNGDVQVQPEEISMQPGGGGGVTVMPDLSFCLTRVSGENSTRFAPVGFSGSGVPLYDLAKGEVLAKGVQAPASSGGDQMLAGADGWTVVTLGMAPFAKHSFSGSKDGVPKWSYPNMWPGLHASHEAPAPTHPGELVGPTRLMGGFITPGKAGVGQIWGVNANMGAPYLFTSDGLFVATLFSDKRTGKSWNMPVATRNMSLDGVTLHEENFWPTMTQTEDGKVYIMNGGRAAFIRLDGLDTIYRLPDSTIKVGPEDLQKAQAYLVAAEVQRQQAQGRGILEIALRQTAPKVDGTLDEWTSAAWVDIDKSGVAANFNSDSKPYDVTAALTVSGDRLYAAFRTNDAKLLVNSGEVANAPFKTGGALDIMLGVNEKADPKRTNPAAGDLRLLVTMAKGKPLAVLYQPVVPGTKSPIPFSSPWRTITLDRADDVSSQVELAGKDGNYELSIPLAALGLKPEAGKSLRGDLGILRGDGLTTTARVYWSNKSTGITSDVPSEAMLAPSLWGRAEFKAVP